MSIDKQEEANSTKRRCEGHGKTLRSHGRDDRRTVATGVKKGKERRSIHNRKKINIVCGWNRDDFLELDGIKVVLWGFCGMRDSVILPLWCCYSCFVLLRSCSSS
jgi:hypothetical protein